jgi:excisionase family DNA binding protein
MEQLLSVREASAWLNISPGTLYVWAAEGRIPVQRVGRCLRFRIEDLEAWLGTQRNQARRRDDPFGEDNGDVG